MLDDIGIKKIKKALKNIKESLELIEERAENIQSSDDFLEDKEGLEKLDSISMRLVAIGEGFKNIDKLTDKLFLPLYPDINWKDIKGIRDVLSHHYFDIDAEEIFKICKDELKPLILITDKMIERVDGENNLQDLIKNFENAHDLENGMESKEIKDSEENISASKSKVRKNR
jgi:uncharacterized protein with HEPN domain